jgi:arsenite methyltransferase
MDLAKCCLLPSNSGGCSSYRFQVRFDEVASLQEAFRVLKPGGRFAVSDVVVRGHVPAGIKKSLELWAGCVAGALSEKDYLEKLAKAGFDQISIEATRVYNIDDARVFLSNRGLDVDDLARQVGNKFISAFVRATKPAAGCCAPSCCS